MNSFLIRLFGYKAMLFHGDPTTFDRWTWLRNHLSKGHLKTLDAGCGSGAFTLYASQIGNNSTGLSSDAFNMQKANHRANLLKLKNVQFISADLRELENFREQLGEFDQIICCEAIEHILDDRKLIQNLSSLLKSGGKLLLTTPYKHYKPLWGDQLSQYEDGGHVRWGYTFDEIKELFQANNIKVTNESYISGIISQKITNLMRYVGTMSGKGSWLISFPLRIFQPMDRFVTELIHYPYLSIGVVGIKL